jgi:transcriptional regulator with XRE-family HTH domain
MERTKLIEARQRKHLSAKALSDRVGVDGNTIYRWEHGEQMPRGYNVEALCEALDTTAEELGLVEEAIETSEKTVYPYMDVGDDMNKKRRVLIEQMLQLTNVSFASQTIDALEQQIAALTKPPVDKTLLWGLKQTTANFWQLRITGYIASPDLLNSALAHLQILKSLFNASHSPSSRALLCTVFSETAIFLGKLLSTDLHLSSEGHSYYSLALTIAQQTGDDTLYAVALARLGELAASQKKTKAALDALQAAQRLSGQAGSTIRSWIAAETAESQAMLFIDRDIWKPSLEQAETFAQHISADEETFGMHFDQARIPGYQGSCYLRQQSPYAAIPALQEALQPLEASGALARAVTLDLAEAHIQAGSVEPACAYLEQGLNAALQSQSSLERIYDLRERIEPWKSASQIKALDEQLAIARPIT